MSHWLSNLKTQEWGPWTLVLCAFFLPLSTVLTNVCLIAGAMFALWSMKKDATHYLTFKNPFIQGSLAWVALTLIGCLYTSAQSQDMLLALKDVIKLLLVTLFIPLLSTSKTEPQVWFKRVCVAIIAAMCVTLVFAFLKEVFHLPIGQKYTHAAVFKNYIKTNFFMAFAAFLCAHAAYLYPHTRKFFIPLIAVMTFYIFFVSIGRTGYATYAVLAILFCWQRFSFKGIFLGLSLVATLFGVGYLNSSTLHKRVFQIHSEISNHQNQTQVTSVGSRLEFYQNSIALIAKNPLWGTGTGSFKTEYQNKINGTQAVITDNPHSEYLHVGVEFGFLGLLVLFYFCLRFVNGALLLPSSAKTIAQGVILSFILGSFANSWFMDFTECLFLVIVGCACFACYPKNTFNKPSKKEAGKDYEPA